VFCAFDGQEGLEKALEVHPDLILCDIMMPRMSGDRMVREIRLHPELEDVPIMLLTAKAAYPPKTLRSHSWMSWNSRSTLANDSRLGTDN
jgi:CheY-like chemotaxis protein